MLFIRLYLCVLTLVFLLLVATTRGVGMLEATVITCSVVYLILDVRADLQKVRGEVLKLNKLEKTITMLLR